MRVLGRTCFSLAHWYHSTRCLYMKACVYSYADFAMRVRVWRGCVCVFFCREHGCVDVRLCVRAGIVATSLSFIQCIDVDGIQVLKASPDVPCYSRRHKVRACFRVIAPSSHDCVPGCVLYPAGCTGAPRAPRLLCACPLLSRRHNVRSSSAYLRALAWLCYNTASPRLL